MKRKITAVLLAAAALMAGCNDNNLPEDEFASDSAAFSQTGERTTAPKTEKTTAALSTQAKETTAAEETSAADDEQEHGKLRCIWYVDGISLVMDGVAIQKIEMQELPDSDHVKIEDFNSDGYEDVFIPDKDNKSGNYWIYDPNSKKFDISDDPKITKGD